jgi:hypothetical protein
LVDSAFFPVSTATAVSAGNGLANALSLYMLGQKFGSGVVVAQPGGAGAAASAFINIFLDRDLPNTARAQQLANACQALALTTLVVFPYPLPPSVPLT